MTPRTPNTNPRTTTPDNPPRTTTPTSRTPKEQDRPNKRVPIPRRAHKFTDEDRSHVLDLLREGASLAEISRQTGASRTTIHRWGAKAGVSRPLPDNIRAQAAAMRANREAHVEDARAAAVTRLERIVDQSGVMLNALSETGAEYTDAINALPADAIAVSFDPDTGRSHVVVDDPRAELALKRGLALARFPIEIRDLIGLHTRAIHDLQLLRGEATERAGVEVVLNVPRPDFSTGLDVIEGTIEP